MAATMPEGLEVRVFTGDMPREQGSRGELIFPR